MSDARRAATAPIYMDHQATTPPDPRVVDAMLPYLTEHFGNAASHTHGFGRTAEAAVDTARDRIATLIGARKGEIVLTSGATESDNLALKGVAWRHGRPAHLVTTSIEHKAVLDTCAFLERRGWTVTYVDVGPSGVVRPADVDAALTDDTVLASVMAANNEVGTVQPIAEIGALCEARGVLFHTDAAQAAGKVPLDVVAQHLHLASLSAHKLYGPKGVGALYVRRRTPRVRLVPLVHGGGHERGMRSGTLDVPAIVGFGEAARIALEQRKADATRIRALRDRLLAGLSAALDAVHVHGDLERRIPGNLNVSFGGVDAEPLLLALREVALSSGSACTSATLEPSYVLRAMGVSEDLAAGSIRFGLGRGTTEDEVDHVVARVAEEVPRLRELSPLWPR